MSIRTVRKVIFIYNNCGISVDSHINFLVSTTNNNNNNDNNSRINIKAKHVILD